MTSPLEKEPDFYCENNGVVFLLRPITESAQSWVKQNLPEDTQWFGDNVIVDVSRIWAILTSIQESGLVVR